MATLCAAAALTAPLVQAGAPGAPSRVIDPARSAAMARARPVAADIRFMQDMAVHHAQAVAMVALIEDRTSSPTIRDAGRRIGLSQAAEIDWMHGWLERRGQSLSNPENEAMAGMAMNGMLSKDQMDALAAATGPAFERLFLSGMVAHHQGALDMARTLRATPRAGQDSDLSDFVTNLVADQRAEIARMQAMLAAHQGAQAQEPRR